MARKTVKIIGNLSYSKNHHEKAYRALITALRELREKRGLRQAEVSASLGRYPTFITKVESGERSLDPIELCAILKCYRMPLVRFIRELGLEC